MRYTGKGLAHVPHMVGKQKLKTFPSLPTVICVSWSSTVSFCNIYCCYFVGFFLGGGQSHMAQADFGLALWPSMALNSC